MRRSWISTTLALLFMIGQFHTALHAAEYGGDVHYHDDVVCISVLPEDEYDPAVLSQSHGQFFYSSTQPNVNSVSERLIFSLIGFIPPPNGPPQNA